jgi:hypothetical protein
LAISKWSSLIPAETNRGFRPRSRPGRVYLQIAESRREGDQVRQQVIAMLGAFRGFTAANWSGCCAEDYAIAGVEGLDLHHLYRAMAWPGEEPSEQEQNGRNAVFAALPEVTSTVDRQKLSGRVVV